MIVWIVATVLAFFVKGLCGFANTLIFTSVMSFTVSNATISPIELILNYPSNVILAVRGRKKVRLSVVLPITALILAGCIPGILLLQNVDVSSIKVLFGFVIMGIGVEMLWRHHHPEKGKWPKVVRILVALISGVLCGLYGIGALVAAYLNQITDDTEELKASMGFVFAVENTVRLILYITFGMFALDSAWQALWLLPISLLALTAGIFSARYIKESVVRMLVIFLLILSGFSLVIGNL